jgi:valyl-tRNA synthetase
MIENSLAMGSSLIAAGSSLLDVYEETDLEETHKRELEELIKSVPYNLCVALIKISQLHNYEPLDIETLYQKVLPAFSLLRRNDGTKYTSQSVQTVRSAMVSNKLYTRNGNGKYVLNIQQAIKILRNIKNKKSVNTNQQLKQVTYDDNSKIRGNLENMDNNNSSFMNYENPSSFMNSGFGASLNVVGGKKKHKKVKKGKEGVKQRIEKFEKTFLVLKKFIKSII